MVLLRQLLTAPTFTVSPTRLLLLSQWRPSSLHCYGLVPSKFRVSAPGGNFRCLSDGIQGKNSRFQSPKVPQNWRVKGGWKGFSGRRIGDGDGGQTTWIQCSSSAVSKRELEIRFPVTLEENTTVESDVEAVIEQIKIDGPVVLRMVAEEMEDMETTETVELSVVLCNDLFIQDLNSKWLGKDCPTDVLSFPQDQDPGLTPHLLLGDVIISLDTAARQASERGHTLLDELRILLVHGLLHVLGYDHELGAEESQDMEEKETEILSKVGWKGKGLITATQESSPENGAESVELEEPVRRPAPKPAFKFLFCDMDGTLLDGKSKVRQVTADALRAAMAKGVQVIIATGKTQYGAMAALRPVGLTGEGGVISPTSPGVFTQGLQVYGKGGVAIYSATLERDIVREAFDYSMKNNLPTVGFSANRIVTLFQHQFTDALHELYLEPKAEVVPSLGDLLASCPIQKLLVYDTPEAIKYKIRPFWAAKSQGRVTLVQALDDMLEILPPGQSKGAGVRMLLDHLGVSPEEVMAIGDGENDIEMLALVGWGVAMKNGSPLTKEVANALTATNDEDGAAQAIYKYILS